MLQMQEQLAGSSARAGVQAFAEGAAQSALGALELCGLLGFKGRWQQMRRLCSLECRS